jgi:hypothetical protein
MPSCPASYYCTCIKGEVYLQYLLASELGLAASASCAYYIVRSGGYGVQ